MKGILFALPILMAGLSSHASEGHRAHVSKYVGQETRTVKSLSPEDIAELKRGGGWGLAKSAELNGVPGPAHLLELKDEIPLDAAQVAALTRMFRRMQTQAIKLGERLIALERELENHFRNHTITDAVLRSSLAAIAKVRRDLRYTHLATHLQTPAILTEEQIKKYNRLRGYSDPNPCASVPKGHDPKMWRKHNGCD